MSGIALTSRESKTRLFYSRIADNRYPHRIVLHVPDGEPEHVIDMTDAEALAFARQSSQVQALVEAALAMCQWFLDGRNGRPPFERLYDALVEVDDGNRVQ